MIHIEALKAKIGGSEILRGIDLHINPGEFAAIVGPNGAGKTTLLRHINGLRKPTSGTVRVAGLDTRKARTSEFAKIVGFLFQNPDHQILASTVAEEIAFGLKHTGVPKPEWETRIAESAARLKLESLLDADPFSLPRSSRQRVALASIVAIGPEVLVLDEPTSAQDERGSALVMEIASELNGKGSTVLLVSHDMELVADFADRLIVLADGRIRADGTPHQVFTDDAALEDAGLRKPGTYRIAKAIGFKPLDGERLNAASLAARIERARLRSAV